MSWLGASHLKDVVQAAGFEVSEVIPLARKPEKPSEKTEAVPAEEEIEAKRTAPEPNKVFELAGRPELATFFNEHIVDIILHRDRYKALGIEFPSAVILHGPPGCGKTFAVDRLVDFSAGRVFRSTPPAWPVPTSTRPARRSRRCSTRRWKTRHPFS